MSVIPLSTNCLTHSIFLLYLLHSNLAQCRLSESHQYLLSEIRLLNRSYSAMIHVLIVSVDVESSIVEICSELCRVSRESMYMEVKDGPDDLDDALAKVASLVIGCGKQSCCTPRWITMEKF